MGPERAGKPVGPTPEPPPAATAPAGRKGRGHAVRRVAFVVAALHAGGMERVIVHLAGATSRLGVEPTVLCLREEGRLADELKAAGLPVVTIGSARGYDLAGLVRLARALQEVRPDVINVHDLPSLPYVVAANGLSVRRPLVFTAHGLLFQEIDKPRLRVRLAARWLAAVTAVSDEAGRRHAQYMAWRRRVDVIPNGVPIVDLSDRRRQDVREALGVAPETFVFLSIGNAKPEKGFEDLLDAAAALQDAGPGQRFVCLVAGELPDDAYGKGLLRRREELGLSQRVRFLGFRSDVAGLYGAADAFVIPSRSEGLPMVLLEAMTASLPVVATRVGGIGAVLGDGAGLLADSQSPAQLSGQMLRLLTDAGLRGELAARGHRLAVEEYGVERMARRYLDTFRRVANKR